MITFSTTSNFDRRIADLKAVKRGVYATVEDEIRASFQGLEDFLNSDVEEIIG